VLVAAFAVLPAPVNAAAPTSAPRAIEPVISAAMIVLRPKFMSVLLLSSSIGVSAHTFVGTTVAPAPEMWMSAT